MWKHVIADSPAYSLFPDKVKVSISRLSIAIENLGSRYTDSHQKMGFDNVLSGCSLLACDHDIFPLESKVLCYW